MPGDELYDEATVPANAVADLRGERTGPRHAAPRKPFLTRLHLPAGKAVAMAAMPSAVLMSMGITPQLAYAKPLPKNPFREGPCVSQQDKAEEERKEAEAAEEARAAKEAEAKAEAERKAEEEKRQEAAQEDSSGSGDSPGGESTGGDSGAAGGLTDSGGSSEPEPEPEPEPSPSETEGGGLLGGVGDAIDGLLGGGSEQEEQAAAGTATEAGPTQQPDSATDGAEKATDPVGDAVDKVEKGLEDATGKVEEGLEDTAGELPVPEPEGESAEDEPATEPVGEEGKPAFPCVEEKKVAGEDEATPAVLPNQPWTLKASSLSLHGLDYEGVFNVRTADGRSKQVLKFTADSIDIGDLHQIVQGPNGTLIHVRAAPGSTSTIRNSQVTMYTERLEGKLFGLIPIVFDPQHPPPLNIPEAYFTDVTVTQAGQFGGTLTVPGLSSTIESG